MGSKEEDIFIRFKIKVVVKEEVKTIITRLRLGHTALNYSQNEQTRVWELQSMWISRSMYYHCTAYKNERKCLVEELKEMGIGNITIKKLLNNGLENYRVYKIIEYINH